MKEIGILFMDDMVAALLSGVDPKRQTRRVIKPQPSDDAVRLYLGDIVAGDMECSESGDYFGFGFQDENRVWRCPYGKPGNRLWVRETYFAFGRWETRFSTKKGRDEWHFIDLTIESGRPYSFEAPTGYVKAQRAGAWSTWWKRPSLFMPRIACRVVLEVVDVRIERLQEISEADAIAEGIECTHVDSLGRKQWRMYAHTDGTPGPDGEAVTYVGKPYTSKPVESYKSLWLAINGPGSWDTNPWVWAIDFRRVDA
jgi:hypothetical protein